MDGAACELAGNSFSLDLKLTDKDFVGLDESLSRLAEIDERGARIVELRYFVGLSNEEIAEVLGISVSSVKREWQVAKIWLFKDLSRE